MVILLFLAILLAVGLLILSVLIRALTGSMDMPSEQPRVPVRFGWALLVAITALNVFAYDVPWGLGWGLFGAALVISTLICFEKGKRDAVVWLFAIIGIAAGAFLGFRSNGFVQVVDALALLLSLKALVLLLSVRDRKWNVLWILKVKAGLLISLLHRPSFLGGALRVKDRGDRTLFSAIRTVLITLVVLLFFTAILSSADPVFDRVVSEVRDQALGRTIASALLFGLLGVSLTLVVSKQWEEKVPRLTAFKSTELLVPAIALAALFGLFLAIQARYLFGGQEAFQALDVTYSDYVRRGFVELLIASFFGVIVTYVIILKQHALEDMRQKTLLKWASGALLVELLLLLASAAKRDILYVEAYGITRVRVIGGLFLLWLAGVILLVLALNYAKRVREGHVLLGTVALSVLVLAVLNIANIDLLIARSAPPKSQARDLFYAGNLSVDVAPEWEVLVLDAEQEYEALRKNTTFTDTQMTRLADIKLAMGAVSGQAVRTQEHDVLTDWRAGTWSDREAARIARDTQRIVVGMSTCVRDGIRELEALRGIRLLDHEVRRINDYEYLFLSTKVSPDWMSDVLAAPPGVTESRSCRPEASVRPA